ncbi:MAG: pyridoxamine 5'-phosphate oxidase family protein [Candidatus Omnitrophica bacterium]|nr:pyridoxamine 5'-phosphate oxidase family protein [Candidatus Omnitrophota bacterium]
MTCIPENVRQAWENRDGPAIFATVDAAGAPNIIYVTCVALYGDDRFVIADNYFHKTRRNLQTGCTGALLFREKEGKAYQVKGTLAYHTGGEIFENMKTWNPPPHPGHAAVSLLVEQAFSGAERLGCFEFK